jgi:micrococcal nuclease
MRYGVRARLALVSALALLVTACGAGGSDGEGDGDPAAGPGPAAGSGAAAAPGAPRPPADAFAATVERVVDGDTFIATRNGRRVRVRLIGIDAPESVKPDSPVECFGNQSSAHLKNLLPRGSRLTAAYQGAQQRDANGRDLWDAWLPDGRFVQGVLVRAGSAQARRYRPQVAHADYLAAVERAARAERAGLHGACPAGG